METRQYLKALWYLFIDSPARGEDNTTVPKSFISSLNFCETSRIEDDKEAERAVEIWPNIEACVDCVLKQPKRKQPISASFRTIRSVLQDTLTFKGVHVLICIAKILKPPTVKYQTDEAVIMFLAGDLSNMCHKLMVTFLKKSVMHAANTTCKLANVLVTEIKNHKPVSDIDIEFLPKISFQ